MISTIEAAVAEIIVGRPVLVVDDADRENEVDLVVAGEVVTERWMSWAVCHGSGVVCASLPDAVADRLGLPPIVNDNQKPLNITYTISVDARAGVSTGISVAERTRTIALLADPAAVADDFTRPGHVFPLRARVGGVLERPGHTEASMDLCRLAGLAPVGAIVELVHDDGSMMRLADVEELAQSESLLVISIADLIHRRRHDCVLRRAQTTLPTEHGNFTIFGYDDRRTGAEHVALVSPLGIPAEKPLVRMHSECLTGDVFGSRRCDCDSQLQESLQRVGAEGGVIVYLRGHEGRGVGLVNKLRAYALQDDGLDTVDAQLALGLPVDTREFDAAAAILTDLGVSQVRLLTNNPSKQLALKKFGLIVERQPLEVGRTAINNAYLNTKRTRLGHILEAS